MSEGLTTTPLSHTTDYLLPVCSGPQVPHLDGAVLATTDCKGAAQSMKQEEGEEILGVLSTVNSAHLERATAPTAWVWPVPMATQLKCCVVESNFHTRTEASFELETRVSPLVSRHSTIPACPASTWEEEEGHGQCRGTSHGKPSTWVMCPPGSPGSPC